MTFPIPVSRKWLLAGLLSVTVAASGTTAWSTPAAAAVAATHAVTASEYEAFLKEKLNLALPASVAKGDFLAALAEALGAKTEGEPVVFKDLPATSPYYAPAQALYRLGVLTSDTVRASDRLSAINAVQIALKAADLKELAYTYPASKVKQALAKVKLNPATLGTQAAQELAAAIDTGLLPPAYYADLKPNAAASRHLSAVLIGQTLAVKGLYKHYLGYASDSDIYAKLNDAYQQSDIIQAPELRKIVDAALEESLVTGYNLKDARYDANFVDSLSLVYGHSDLTHALQLIGLLRSEGIDAKVQFEPKTSAFVYLKEWGEPGVSDQYEVRQIANGNYIEYAKEYDIAFEFDNLTDKKRFDDVVHAYAKKNKEDQTGLIAGSWWQPLYYSFTELPSYRLITNNKIDGGRYYAQSFSLKEKSAEVVEGFRRLDPAAVITHKDFWVDVPFFNYLNGESL
ncbi:hypothetical protein [Cohnella sp. REN36]|uniref:hypothetical protein n=1 Tax=Cohnella sp. REN36 TaxID=2887347 RepID=UPI001D134BE5|nr:hypothetical protein [Cohnella sp. REN36]MCC3371669.1 hypothetical protein [Cohnella sp. REN36]